MWAPGRLDRAPADGFLSCAVVLRELALFAGAGGGILGGRLLGWRTICAVECDPYARAVLCARQDDGSLDPFPIWDDVRTFDPIPWRGRVDVVSGGFPCQDISTAGKGQGITGARSGLWREMARIVRDIRPRFVFVENSPALTIRGLGTVLGDLAALGYNAEWGVLGAADVGAPHRRDRIWILGYLPNTSYARFRRRQPRARNARACWWSGIVNAHGARIVAHADGAQLERRRISGGVYAKHPDPCGACWWGAEPGLGRVANGVAHRVDRLRCTGNGQVPQAAAEAFRKLSQRIGT